jgi:hypothetical protein
MQTLVSIALGIGLAAACGFRVFVPLLGLSLAARSEVVKLSPELTWIGGTPALIALGTATLLEILAYYIPAVDHALDAVATPAAVLAGALASAAVLPDLPPHLRWGIAIIAGGGVAGIVQGATVLTRLKSLGFTGGLGNPIVATLELLGSLVVTVLALFLPLLALAFVILLCTTAFVLGGRVLLGRRSARPTP